MEIKVICRSCKSNKLYDVVDLGHTPPSNLFLKEDDLKKKEVFYPLKTFVCSNCWLVQTLDVIDEKSLFNPDYPYLSSYSETFLSHVNDYTRDIINRFNLSNSNSLLEIASNDGIMRIHGRKLRTSGWQGTGARPLERTIRCLSAVCSQSYVHTHVRTHVRTCLHTYVFKYGLTCVRV